MKETEGAQPQFAVGPERPSAGDAGGFWPEVGGVGEIANGQSTIAKQEGGAFLGYAVRRVALPGEIDGRTRYLTRQGGWTFDASRAMRFFSQEAAAVHLGGRDGEIIERAVILGQAGEQGGGPRPDGPGLADNGLAAVARALGVGKIANGQSPIANGQSPIANGQSPTAKLVIEWRDPKALREHPSLKGTPRWGDGDERLKALARSVKEHGVREPLRITAAGAVIDGRHRLAAAKRMGLERVPCIVADEGEAATIVLDSLLSRRHLTKGQRAYVCYPFFAQAHQEALERRLAGLKKGQKPQQFSVGYSVTNGRMNKVDSFAEALGISGELFAQAAKLHRLFGSDPGALAEWEPRIMDEESPVGLGAVIAGLAGRKATKGKPKIPTFEPERNSHLHKFFTAWSAAGAAAGRWEKLEEEEREQAREKLEQVVTGLPDDVLSEMRDMVRAEVNRRKRTG